ncbi:His Kinase A (phospho-acceptor) domain-containing protein [Sphingomonas sp. YR710]|uniref:response regulator n=1 Tax=Sphingomonas sp. YR710 TaxID=1882773 RepID=UPI00087E321C|nr:response regulator [Sphingomonas sp. YR710]SDC48567.1 His Kinase A (phospho-acceptor) domain-containing protein [Sphingomonas sp. YR710]
MTVAIAPRKTARVSRSPSSVMTRRARVLLVDDDPHNLLAIRTVIEEVADIFVAASGEEALRQLLKSEFAVILLDVFMPGMDGYETAQLIRQRPNSRHTPIIFLSAVNKEDAHLLRGYAMGAVDYVFKPVEPIVLRSKVSVFVDLYEKTQEIKQKAVEEQRLLDENLRIQGERLAAEQTLRQLEQRQALIVQSLPIILYLEPIDARPRVPQFVGGNFQALTGFPFGLLQEQPDLWAERLHPEDRDRVLQAYADRASAGGMAIEYRWRCADGRYKHFSEQAVLLRDSEGRAAEFAGSLLDVSERRALEAQLTQSLRLDAIGKLTGGIAHDFNNLLAAVLGGLRLIERRGGLNEKGQQLLDMARHAAEQGADLIGRLLAFARRQQLTPAPVAIDRLSASLKALMEHTLGGLVDLIWDPDPQAWLVMADEGQLELALMNLVINARDAMPNGGTIRIETENVTLGGGNGVQLKPGDYVSISVIDSGTGMAPEIVDRIFEPFFTTKDIGKGTGLGLSMVYGFAQQSEGIATAESILGQGSRICLFIPRATGLIRNEQPDRSTAVNEHARSLRILLVDDHPQVRTMTAAWLEDMGHEVVVASRASEGLERISTDRGIDLLMTDYAMPLISGTDMIHRVRRLYPNLPVVLLTGYADASMIANKPDDIILLGKPFRHEQLVKAITAAVRPAEDIQ